MPKGANMLIAFDENGISKSREATAEEIEYIQTVQAEAAEAKKIEIAEREAFLSQRKAIAERLGLTADELKILLG